MESLNTKNEIKSFVATWRNFAPEKPIENAVIYFWNSHNNHLDEKEIIQATIDLVHKDFNLETCEKYEVQTGHLNRWNYMTKNFDEISKQELEQAINKGYEEQNIWMQRCQRDLQNFMSKDWKDCISEKENPYYEQCKQLIVEKLKSDKNFFDAFSKTVSSYADRHGKSLKNGEQYILEEISWIFSLPLVHLNKNIYLVHVGNDNPIIKEMFHSFSNLNKAVKWLSPRSKEFTFKNEADFLMYYNVNHRYAGYSYALKNKYIVEKPTWKRFHIQPPPHLGFEPMEKTILQHIIEKLPCHIYWLNRDNVYLGCNLEQAKDFGLKSTHEVIGKNNFDFHDYDTALQLNKINELVMSTGRAYEGEEPAWIEKDTANCLSTKVPLFDIQGKIIGLLGVSLDITDRKRVEELEKQKELYELARKVAHDIGSPLQALEVVQFISLKKLDEKEKHMFQLAIKSIHDISDSLIKKYRKEEKISYNNNYIAVDLRMNESIESKRYEYQDKSLRINFYPDESNKFVFIKGNSSNFSRMMSNLLNNALEAIEDKEGIIDVSYEVKGEEVEIRVKDNGNGMPKEMVEKLNNGEAVGSTREKGHGIGMEQIITTIKEMNGKMEVISTKGRGTEFMLRFNKSDAPKWFAKKIELKKGDTVVILDDEVLIHEVWKVRLKEYENNINVKYFTEGLEAINFLNSIEDKSKVFLFTDYELKGQDINGIEVIEKSQMHERHVLVTSKDLSDIKNFNEKIRLFNKLHLYEIPLSLE
ncbi:MAG: PAS domain-containing sensor histidine kinase [Endomicrobium sp.]|jgi:signal transduction histidine kinase|nr:PAS domain-containing sensor histidine kinase [Endomicrobium sp.]